MLSARSTTCHFHSLVNRVKWDTGGRYRVYKARDNCSWHRSLTCGENLAPRRTVKYLSLLGDTTFLCFPVGLKTPPPPPTPHPTLPPSPPPSTPFFLLLFFFLLFLLLSSFVFVFLSFVLCFFLSLTLSPFIFSICFFFFFFFSSLLSFFHSVVVFSSIRWFLSFFHFPFFLVYSSSFFNCYFLIDGLLFQQFCFLLFVCFILSLFFSFSFFLYDSSMKLSLSVLGIVYCIVPRCPRYGAVKIKVSRNPKPESAHARIQPFSFSAHTLPNKYAYS